MLQNHCTSPLEGVPEKAELGTRFSSVFPTVSRPWQHFGELSLHRDFRTVASPATANFRFEFASGDFRTVASPAAANLNLDLGLTRF